MFVMGRENFFVKIFLCELPDKAWLIPFFFIFGHIVKWYNFGLLNRYSWFDSKCVHFVLRFYHKKLLVTVLAP